MTEKRFQVETDEGFVVSLKDNLAKKYPFSLACESVDDYENVIDEVMSCGVLLNQLWEQTQRFEKHNQRLENENEQLKQDLEIIVEHRKQETEYTARLEEKNEQLKQFISKIDFAIIRKYDNSLENLLDEIYDGEYENWINKQVSRAKKLDGDDE